MPEQSNDYRVVVFGAGGVGKSSLVLRFVKGTFRDTYIPTIEDTYRQVISCDKSVCTLQITDTTGSHQFPAMQRLSISKGHAFILVFSVTSKQSLEELGPIYKLIVQIKGSVEDIPVMLVGNKCDETQREVDTREAQAVAQEWKCAFMETSAKMNYNVKELFQELLTLETRRNMSLNIDGKRSSKQKRTDRIKGKCILIPRRGERVLARRLWVRLRGGAEAAVVALAQGADTGFLNLVAEDSQDLSKRRVKQCCFLEKLKKVPALRICQPAGHRAAAMTSASSTQALALLPGTWSAPADSPSPPPPLLL
ncbi:hypothetical protein AB1E18_005887 [Capra hircus]